MRRYILSLGILFAVGFLFSAFPATLQAQIELKEGMSQGDFALWLVDAIGGMSKLPPAAKGEDAIKFLSELGAAPDGGWKTDEPVSNEMLASLLEKPEEGASLNFEDLVGKVRDRIQNIFDKRKLGVFRVMAPTPSEPAV